MGNELIQKYAFEAVDLIRKKEVSSSELLKASQERHIEVDEQVNALPYTFYDKALIKAKNINIDSERQNKKSLLGLPIAVKDYNDVAGVPTTFGSKIFSNNIPSKSDSTIARLEQNGALPVAKSNVPEWAGGHTFNPVYGVTKNPFNKNKIAGGSSGGSSVALATKQVWLATGNDLGGSLRTPASFNNIVGLRPSIGVVPRGLRYNRFAVDTFDLPAKVAVTEDLGLVPVQQEVRSIFRTVVPHLKTIGCEVGSDIPDFNGAIESFHTLRGLLMAYMLGDLYKSKKDEILVDIVKNIEVGFEASNDEIITAEKIRQDLFIKVDRFFEEYDFLICPTCSVLPFDIETPFVKEIDGVVCKTYIDWFAITFALTLTSCPIISLPVGFSSHGLPVGIQIMSKPRQEDKLLAFAKVLEEKVSVNKNSPI